MPLCLAGLSRKYRNHANTQMQLAMPMTTKEPRQPTQAISTTTMGGVSALPMRANECVRPWAKARSAGFVQLDNAEVAVGNVGPSPTPSSNLAAIIETNPPARPVRIVAPAQTSEQMASTLRGPK